MFRDESSRTQARFRQWHARTSAREDSAVSPLRTARFLPWVLGSPFSQSVLSSSEEETVICHFYHTILHNLSPEDPVHFLHTQLPSLYGKSRTGCALRLATEAISYASSSRLFPEAALISRKRYVRAVQALGQAIQDPTEAASDHTLYAALLLSGYEARVSLTKDLFMVR